MARYYVERLKRKVIAADLKRIRRERDAVRAKLRENDETVKEHLFSLVGRLAIEWTVMETHLDDLIETLHRNGGAGEIQSDLPVSMKNKIAYLRRAHRVVESKLAEPAHKLADRLVELKTLRSDLIHGIAGDFDYHENTWSFARYQFKSEQRTATQTTYRADEVTDGILSIMRLTTNVIEYGTALLILNYPEVREYRENQLPIS